MKCFNFFLLSLMIFIHSAVYTSDKNNIITGFQQIKEFFRVNYAKIPSEQKALIKRKSNLVKYSFYLSSGVCLARSVFHLSGRHALIVAPLYVAGNIVDILTKED